MIHQSIIDLNNTTVILLRQQNYENAMENSSSLLCHYSSDLSQISASIENGNGCLDACMLLSEVGGRCFDNNNKAFIYGHGILIPKSTDIESTMVAAIIIFNSALAHHLCSETLLTGTPQQNLLLKAKRMYELALQVHPVGTDLLFHFTVINNIAVIEAKTGQIETSRKYFEYLMAIMMLLIDHGHTERLRHLQGFLANIKSLTCNTAAAA